MGWRLIPTEFSPDIILSVGLRFFAEAMPGFVAYVVAAAVAPETKTRVSMIMAGIVVYAAPELLRGLEEWSPWSLQSALWPIVGAVAATVWVSRWEYARQERGAS
jgi:hypothetical protein